MIEFGEFALQMAGVVCLCGILFAVVAVVTRRQPFFQATLRALHVVFMLVSLSTLALVMAFLQPKGVPIQLEYVARHSSRDMSSFYKIAALWGGMSGSLLFWLFLLTLFSVLAFLGRDTSKQTSFYAGTAGTLLAVQSFFLYMVVAVTGTQPFQKLAQPMMDGRGLNPLLQNAMMAIHPPMLYIGFVSMSIPFAFAMGALISGDLGSGWIKLCRRWTIMGWAVLGFGITLGSRWAYVELGWGGIWAWDPVENASFLPFLVMTAFLHSVMIQEHRGMLKVWNMVLVILTFLMTIFGTFLTRSGLLQSVHTFAQNKEISDAFLWFMGLILVVGLLLIIWRHKHLKSENKLESFLSREFAFLAANVVLLTLTLTIMIGTLLPAITEWWSGSKRSVGPAYFNVLCLPQLLLLLFLTGYGPLVAWRKATRANLLRNFTLPAIGGLLGGLGMLAYLLWGQTTVKLVPGPLAEGGDVFIWFQSQVLAAYGTIALFAVGGFVVSCLALEVYRGARLQRSRKQLFWPMACLALFISNRRRFGGYTVHLGLVMFFLSVVFFSTFGIRLEKTVKIGESYEIAGYTLTYKRKQDIQRPEYSAVIDHLEVTRDGKKVALLRPENRMFSASEQATSEVALLSMIQADLYVVPVGRSRDGTTFLTFYNPWICFVWLGVLVMMAGGTFAGWPGKAKAKAGRKLELTREELRIPA